MIKKHKAGNVKLIEEKLRSTMNRAAPADSQKQISIRDYNRKCGYEENKKVFIWNSEDDYIKKILLSWGWVQNTTQESPFFHIKWTYTPSFSEHRIVEPQFCNHFRNSH